MIINININFNFAIPVLKNKQWHFRFQILEFHHNWGGGYLHRTFMLLSLLLHPRTNDDWCCSWRILVGCRFLSRHRSEDRLGIRRDLKRKNNNQDLKFVESCLYSQLSPLRHILKFVQLSPGSIWVNGPSGLLHLPSGVPGRAILSGSHWWRTWALTAANKARTTSSLNIFTDRNWLWRVIPERWGFCTCVGRSQSSIDVEIRNEVFVWYQKQVVLLFKASMKTRKLSPIS